MHTNLARNVTIHPRANLPHQRLGLRRFVAAVFVVGVCGAVGSVVAQPADPPGDDAAREHRPADDESHPSFAPDVSVREGADHDRRAGAPRRHRPPFRSESWRSPEEDALFDRLTAEERLRAAEFARDHFPEVFAELRRVRQRNPRMFEQQMENLGREMLELRDILERDPEVGELRIESKRREMQIMRLVHRYHGDAGEEERRRIRDELRSLLGDLFDLQIARGEMEVGRLERRIDNLREHLVERETHKEEFIEEHMHMRLGEGRPFRDRRRPFDDRPGGPGRPGRPRR